MFMSYNIKELLELPAEEKIAIADLLYNSINGESNEEEETETPWYENEEFIKELERRVKDWEEGQEKGYTIDEVKNLMKGYKTNYKRK